MQWRHVLLLGYVEGAAAMLTSIHVFIAEDIAREFNLSGSAVPLLQTFLFFGFFTGVPFFGYLGDRVGRKQGLLVSVALTQDIIGCAGSPRRSTRSAKCILCGFSRYGAHALFLA
ncbi:hypothetical protein CYMTET_29625, partial [Cymbomonas tetramitiformis]